MGNRLTRISRMGIHQLAVTYDDHHDRILVKISTTAQEEVRIWLSRRMTFLLLPALQFEAVNLQSQQLSLPGMATPVRALMAEMQKEQHLNQTDFLTPFESQAKSLPLGEAPLLVTDVNIDRLPKDRLALSFIERLSSDTPMRNVDITLPLPLLHGFLHLLEKTILRSEWAQVPRDLDLPEPEDSKEAGPVAQKTRNTLLH